MNIAKYIDEQIDMLYELNRTPYKIIFPNVQVEKDFVKELDVSLTHKKKDIKMKLTTYRGIEIESISYGNAYGDPMLPIVTAKQR